MTTVDNSHLTLGELVEVVRATDPSVYFVLPRVLRRVIKRDRRVAGFGLNVPHRKSYLIDRKRLEEIVEPDEVTPAADGSLPKSVLLLALPDPEKLVGLSAATILEKYWRLLFHLRVHSAYEELFNARKLTVAAVRRRIHLIGQTEFDEIRAVLRHEDLLLPPRDDRAVYVEFAAVYLELKHFAPRTLAQYFPAIRSFERVDQTLAMDVDEVALLESTRFSGCAPTPAGTVAPSENRAESSGAPVVGECPEFLYPALMQRAEKARASGNHVRSAVLRTRCATISEPSLRKRAADGAEADVRALGRRLQAALHLNLPETNGLIAAAEALLPQTLRGRWTGEARLLYDLQRVCVDHEKDVAAIDVVEWALSLGARPIRRELPHQRLVLMTKHLRSALSRLAAARLSDGQRQQMRGVLLVAERAVEDAMRQRFRPLIHESLDSVGLGADSVPVNVGKQKLVEELLDRIAERGFLTMSDLRDGLSRNALKMPDLSSPAQLVAGDQLLRCDKELSRRLDGVYRRGEFYLRWLQSVSSLGFGTRAGRWITKYLALPFGASYVALEGLQHLAGPLVEASTGVHIHLMNPLSWAIVGFFLLGMLHLPEFRRSVSEKLALLGRALRTVFFEWPMRLRELPAVRRILESDVFLRTYRMGIKPLGLTALVWIAAPVHVLGLREAVLSGMLLFLTLSLFFNSSLGRHSEEIVADWTGRTWRWLRADVFAGLFRLIMETFHRALETVERLLYAVDEWFRFKGSEGPLTFVAKTVFGTAWFFVQYAIRFCVNLLIEPQVNPIKHFPVVTVSHKIILPMTPTLIRLLTPIVGPIYAGTLGTAIVFTIPGIFGFLVWELKENWRLYEANRPKDLRPVLIGSHGETMLRFMRPGFHSGTLPKLFGKLRKAERKAYKTGSERKIGKLSHQLHHVEHSIASFVRRELLTLLDDTDRTGTTVDWQVRVEAGSNRVEIRIGRDADDTPAVIAFEEQSGKLLGSVPRTGWVDELPEDRRAAFRDALAGLYKLAGVDLVREQLQQLLGSDDVPFDIAGPEIVVWFDHEYDREVYYDLHGRPGTVPRTSAAVAASPLPVLETRDMLYSETPIAWSQWLACWRQDEPVSRPAVIPSVRLIERDD